MLTAFLRAHCVGAAMPPRAAPTRSLAPPRSVVARLSHRTYTASIPSSSTRQRELRPRFVVVDREREVASVLRTFNNWHGDLAAGSPLPKPPLPFTAQLF